MKKKHKKPSKWMLRKRLRELRLLIENPSDKYVMRLAQVMEDGIVWATEETKGWDTPAENVMVFAEILRKETQNK